MKAKKNEPLIIPLTLSLLISPLLADVAFVGVEGGAPPNFQAQRWSLASEPKSLAVAGNIFGSSGYYLLAPGAEMASKPVVSSDINLTDCNTAIRRPDFVAMHPVAVAGGTWVNEVGNSLVTKPEPNAPEDAWRVGGITAAVGAVTQSAGVDTRMVNAFSFKLVANEKFRLGIMVDALGGGGASAPDYVSVSEGGNQKAFNSTALTRDGIPELVLFDINGKAGATYTVTLHRKTPADGVVLGFSMITFDRLSGTDAAALAAHAVAAKKSLRIGHFESPGEYMKDFFVFKNGDTYHLFYNVGTADGTQDWMVPGNEEAFGHATSTDLNTWKIHPRVMHVQGDGWEGKTVSAPSVIQTGKGFSMIYTGFDKQAQGCQRIGLATSPDLFNWTRYDGNPVYEGPAWTSWKPGVWADCRDAHVIEHGGKYYMFSNVRHQDGKGGIAIARSADLKHWDDLGPAIKTDGMPESPVVFERGGKFYMIVGSDVGACFVSDKIDSNDWQRVSAFKYPPTGFWSGFEVFQDGKRMIATAFEWKMNGNYIDFWELNFDGEKPYVVYSEADLKK